mmetsp:Transcript_64006/g.101528  ORF Transcript_64006/g.101528 Transcript_64006/m.101528 type:complete len:201 (-) Transcript_64006:119-721(-)
MNRRRALAAAIRTSQERSSRSADMAVKACSSLSSISSLKTNNAAKRASPLACDNMSTVLAMASVSPLSTNCCKASTIACLTFSSGSPSLEHNASMAALLPFWLIAARVLTAEYLTKASSRYGLLTQETTTLVAYSPACEPIASNPRSASILSKPRQAGTKRFIAWSVVRSILRHKDLTSGGQCFAIVSVSQRTLVPRIKF